MKITFSDIQRICVGSIGFMLGGEFASRFTDNNNLIAIGNAIGALGGLQLDKLAKREYNKDNNIPSLEDHDRYLKTHPNSTIQDYWQQKVKENPGLQNMRV